MSFANPPLPDAVLVLQNLTVAAANGTILLQNADFSLCAGELVALTGPSGCGKTSLLRVICGLDDASKGDGQILLQNKTAARWGWPTFRRNMILVGQRPTAMYETVGETLRRSFAYRTNRGKMFSEREAREMLVALGLEDVDLGQNARTLSVGQQQRLCLVRALLLEPLVLLLDEPTSALDADATRRVETQIRDKAERRGLAALVVTHSDRQAREWCDRILDLSLFRCAG